MHDSMAILETLVIGTISLLILFILYVFVNLFITIVYIFGCYTLFVIPLFIFVFAVGWIVQKLRLDR